MAQQGQKKSQKQGGGGSFLDNLIGLALIGGLLFIGWMFIQKNDIHNVADFTAAVKTSSSRMQTCFDDEDMFGCMGDAFANRTPKVSPEKAPEGSGLAELKNVRIEEASDDEYNRTDYKHWVTLDGKCNTREVALKEQGKDVEVDSECRATNGQWFDWYGGGTIDNATKADLDHIIPLGYANAHGGAQWDKDKKQRFANDLTQLLIVSAKENRSKGDKGPSEYMPPNEDYRCDYANTWVKTALKYDVSITQADYDVLQDTLGRCVSSKEKPAPVPAP